MRKPKTNINLVVTSDNSHVSQGFGLLRSVVCREERVCDIKRESYPQRVESKDKPAVSLARKVQGEGWHGFWS